MNDTNQTPCALLNDIFIFKENMNVGKSGWGGSWRMGKNMIKTCCVKFSESPWRVYGPWPNKEGGQGFGHSIPLASAICCHGEGFMKSSPQALLPHRVDHTEPHGQLQPGNQRWNFQRNSHDHSVQLSSPRKAWFPDFIHSKRIPRAHEVGI